MLPTGNLRVRDARAELHPGHQDIQIYLQLGLPSSSFTRRELANI
jgi:hypothetical protein